MLQFRPVKDLKVQPHPRDPMLQRSSMALKLPARKPRACMQSPTRLSYLMCRTACMPSALLFLSHAVTASAVRQETLLHEMIHAYMFLTGNRNTGRDGHGPAFVDKMNDINRSDAFDPMVRASTCLRLAGSDPRPHGHSVSVCRREVSAGPLMIMVDA